MFSRFGVEKRKPDGVKTVVKRSLVTGGAIMIPFAVTLIVVGVVLNFISNTLDPVIGALQAGPIGPDDVSPLQLKVLTVVVFVLFVFAVGFLAEFRDGTSRFGQAFDNVMAAIPGIGSVYTSFDEMSELLLDSDTDSFQEVKLVEYPSEGAYTVAFKTAETPSVIEEATGGEMVTLFMPMAPNPVMGGFVIHISKERVVDVDLTVEQGIRSIVTSGVAIGEDGAQHRGLTESEMRKLGQIERVEQAADPGTETDEVEREIESDPDERIDEYDDAIAPEYSETAQKIAERSAQEGEETVVPPAELAGRDDEDREPTGETPDERSREDE
ncbi:DUF502 domain-containing protein [Natronomonas sp. EA1]|uniref:DUF502 domain-containing protein n=1 Tax=Natronomonas sp. EA1 TaxID=3421655 RepID=UPI003EBF7889